MEEEDRKLTLVHSKPGFPQGNKPTITASWKDDAPCDPVQDIKDFAAAGSAYFRRSAFRSIRGGLAPKHDGEAGHRPEDPPGDDGSQRC